MNVLACSFLKCDAVFGEMPPNVPLQKQCDELKSSLHQRSDNVTDTYDDLASQYADQIEPKVAGMDAGELAQFLTNYMKQVQCLLHIISACRHGDWEAYLAALDDQIQYFYAHDLFHYARLIPVHLAQMNQLEKSDSPFTALFADQALEQKIKELWALHKMRYHLIVLSSHCHTSPLLSMIGCVDSPASQLKKGGGRERYHRSDESTPLLG